MRVEYWHGHEVFTQILETALENGNDFMDIVVEMAKAKCPVGTVDKVGDFVKTKVSFTPKKGKYKGKTKTFDAGQWRGREPGSLRNTVRRVNSRRRPNNIRAYAGSKYVNYAYFVENGTIKMPARPFLRPSFNAMKGSATKIIKEGR